MKHPKIKAFEVLENYRLSVDFDDGKTIIFDVSTLFDRENFALLKNVSFFKTAKLEAGGIAIYWNDLIDISEYEIYLKTSIDESYDFSKGERGKYVERLKESSNIVIIDDDLRDFFPNQETVNAALRMLKENASKV